MSRDRSQVDLLENKRGEEHLWREMRKYGQSCARKSEGVRGLDLDFLYYQFMPLHGAVDIFKPRLRKGQSLCRPLCRPPAFPIPLVILPLSGSIPLPSLCLLSYTSLPLWSRFSCVEKGDGRIPLSIEDQGGRRRRREAREGGGEAMAGQVG